MKLHKGFLLLIVILLTGCGNAMSRDTWDTLEYDMSLQKVEENFSKPKKSLLEEQEMLSEINRKRNINDDFINNPEFSFMFESDSVLVKTSELTISTLEELHSLVSEGEDFKIHQYEIESDDRDKSLLNVYFYKDRVIFYDGMYAVE